MFRRGFIRSILCAPVMLFFTRKKPARRDSDFVMTSVGEASMCWEHPERAGVFDSGRAAEIGDRIRQHYADGIGDFSTARRRVCDEMKSDDGLNLAYRSNISMSIHDNSALSVEACDRLAEKIMQTLFEA